MIDDLLQEAEREHREKLEAEARSAVELRARLPEIVRETVAMILEEADDLEHARELAGIEDDMGYGRDGRASNRGGSR